MGSNLFSCAKWWIQKKKYLPTRCGHLASRRLIDLQLLHEMLETHEDILPSSRLWPSISPRELSEETSLTWNSPTVFRGGKWKLREPNGIHPRKLTHGTQKMEVWKIMFVFKRGVVFRLLPPRNLHFCWTPCFRYHDPISKTMCKKVILEKKTVQKRVHITQSWNLGMFFGHLYIPIRFASSVLGKNHKNIPTIHGGGKWWFFAWDRICKKNHLKTKQIQVTVPLKDTLSWTNIAIEYPHFQIRNASSIRVHFPASYVSWSRSVSRIHPPFHLGVDQRWFTPSLL